MNVLRVRTGVLLLSLAALTHCSGNTIEAYPEELVGIGVVVKARHGRHVVQEIIEGGPAHQAGLSSGSRLIRIDDMPTRGQSLASIVERLRGHDGTQVELQVEGPDGAATLTVQRRRLARVEGQAYQAN